MIKFLLAGLSLGLLWFNELRSYVISLFPQLTDMHVKLIASGLIILAVYMRGE